MISKEYLKEPLYKFIASEAFKKYYQQAMLNEAVRVQQVPGFVVSVPNHGNQSFKVQLTSDYQNVKVTRVDNFSSVEVGFFPLKEEGKQVPSKPKTNNQAKAKNTRKRTPTKKVESK